MKIISYYCTLYVYRNIQCTSLLGILSMYRFLVLTFIYLIHSVHIHDTTMSADAAQAGTPHLVSPRWWF